MPGAPLLIIRPNLIINWWNLATTLTAEDGTSKLYFVDGKELSVTLNVEETKAFLAFAKNIGDTLDVKSPGAPQASQGGGGSDARGRFAGLIGDGE